MRNHAKKTGQAAASTITPKRSMVDVLMRQHAKKPRQAEPKPAAPAPASPATPSLPKPASPSPAQMLQAGIDNPADDEDWAQDQEPAQLVDEDSGPSAPELAQPVVDDNGWIRIGPQPVATHDHDIRSAPLSHVQALFRKKLVTNSKMSDAKVPGVDIATIQTDCERLMQEMLATLV